jgi:hypothetical protein
MDYRIEKNNGASPVRNTQMNSMSLLIENKLIKERF